MVSGRFCSREDALVLILYCEIYVKHVCMKLLDSFRKLLM